MHLYASTCLYICIYMHLHGSWRRDAMAPRWYDSEVVRIRGGTAQRWYGSEVVYQMYCSVRMCVCVCVPYGNANEFEALVKLFTAELGTDLTLFTRTNPF